MKKRDLAGDFRILAFAASKRVRDACDLLLAGGEIDDEEFEALFNFAVQYCNRDDAEFRRDFFDDIGVTWGRGEGPLSQEEMRYVITWIRKKNEADLLALNEQLAGDRKRYRIPEQQLAFV